LLADVGET